LEVMVKSRYKRSLNIKKIIDPELNKKLRPYGLSFLFVAYR